MRASEDDRMNVRVAVCAIYQLFQLFGDLGIKQRMWASVDTSDEYRAVVLDIDVTIGPRGFAAILITLRCFHNFMVFLKIKAKW